MDRITFDRSLYNSDAVAAAATAYAEYADITLERSSDAAIAVVGAVRGSDRETVEHSFCNLALQETVVRMRRDAPPAGRPQDAPE
jgi:hypothetical protein